MSLGADIWSAAARHLSRPAPRDMKREAHAVPDPHRDMKREAHAVPDPPTVPPDQPPGEDVGPFRIPRLSSSWLALASASGESWCW